MKTGDKVKVIGIPPGLYNDNELRTLSLFEHCVGKIFEVAGLENIEGLDGPLLKLDVGHVIGAEPWEHTIWIEQEYVEPLDATLTTAR